MQFAQLIISNAPIAFYFSLGIVLLKTLADIYFRYLQTKSECEERLLRVRHSPIDVQQPPPRLRASGATHFHR